MVHSSVSVKEMCDLSKVLFEDTFQAADFVYGGLQNLMKREGNCASRIFLEQFMSIRSGHEKLSISNEVLMLCKDLMNLCRKGLRRVSHLIVGGIFYNASQASEGLGQLVYLSNPSKEFERGIKINICYFWFIIFICALSVFLASSRPVGGGSFKSISHRSLASKDTLWKIYLELIWKCCTSWNH